MPLLVLTLGCGKPGSSENVAPRRADGGLARGDAEVAVAPLALGMPEIAGFAYRARAGHAAFRLAREKEAAGEWTAVAKLCRDALAADQDHLDAAYLYAVALAKTGASSEQIIAPLSKAVAGDYAKWGAASLEQPALQPFLATALGQAWRKGVEAERATFTAGLGRSLLVTSEHDLFAYDHTGKRWYRLTRTGGAVVATLYVRSQRKLAYVTRERVKQGKQQRTRVGVGLVDLATGRSRKSIELSPSVSPSAPVMIGYNHHKYPGFVVQAGTGTWRLVDNGKLSLEGIPASEHATYPAFLVDMTRLIVKVRSSQIDRPAVDHISADWDDKMLASAIKIGRSNKVVTVPSPGLIAGDTAIWSDDRTQLAFAAQLSDTCKPNVATAAAFVADGATGSVRELESALGGIAIEWYGERTLAIAGDHGVSIVSIDGNPPIALAGADGLVTPRKKPKCSPEEPIDEPLADDEDTAAEPSDAGVH